ncbi:hypothetical protein OS493_038628 [Desmophyllum pertusum]|uniref:Uncharacterized protein n=1 Tax=Desmophyllum pertusum TaxID=174260 RepID=A0A9W9ZKT4_9CNID|nr:hypothetical protein OS493_038628 [Desmophyllum pertusum]
MVNMRDGEKARDFDDFKKFKFPDVVKSQLSFPDLVVVRPAFLEMDFSTFMISGKKQLFIYEPHDNTKLYEAHIQEASLDFNPTSKKFRRKKLLESTFNGHVPC